MKKKNGIICLRCYNGTQNGCESCELQQGLAKLQAEGVVEGLKAANVQQAQADSQRKADTKAAAAAVEGLMSANGLAPADVKAYIDSKVVHDARRYSKQGSGLPAARLEELQEGLAKLQAEGVLEGAKAAKVQHAQADAQRKTDTKAAVATLDDLRSASGLAPADVKAYIDLELANHARRYAKQGWGLAAARLEELQEGLAKLQAEGVLEGIAAAKAYVAAKRRQHLEGPKAASAGKSPPTKRKRPELCKPGNTDGPPAPLSKRMRFQVTFKKRTQQAWVLSAHPGRFAGAAQLVNTAPVKHLLRLQEEGSYAAGWLLPAPAGSERCMAADLQRYLKKHGQVGATQSCDVLVLPDELVCHVTSGMLVQPPGSICVLSCL
jgi:hypothetical protein